MSLLSVNEAKRTSLPLSCFRFSENSVFFLTVFDDGQAGGVGYFQPAIALKRNWRSGGTFSGPTLALAFRERFVHPWPMSEVTQVLNAIEPGDPKAADQLLPLVYEELHRLSQQD